MAQNKQWENIKNSSKKDSSKSNADLSKEHSSKSSSWSSIKPEEDDRERRDGPGGN